MRTRDRAGGGRRDDREFRGCDPGTSGRGLDALIADGREPTTEDVQGVTSGPVGLEAFKGKLPFVATVRAALSALLNIVPS
jgi:hypothetical protein